MRVRTEGATGYRAGTGGDPMTATETLVMPEEPRLTSLSHGGGCGCKIAPGVLSSILRGAAAMPVPEALLVGIETADDAAVWKLNNQQALVATTDFFMPIVDDPSTSAASPRPTRFRTSMPWAAPRSWRSLSSACRSPASPTPPSPPSSKAAPRQPEPPASP